MRIAAYLNGTEQFVSSIRGAGYLSAHLNLSDRPKEHTKSQVLRVEGFDTNSPTETVSLKWPELALSIGDVVRLDVLEDGPGSPPEQRKSSSDAPSNLFESPTLAAELLAVCQTFESQLFGLMEKSQAMESEEEHQKFRRAIGNIVAELGEQFLYPVYRRHSHLMPGDLKGELL
jgi:hypothetical protein